MLDILTEVQKFETELDKEMKGLVTWTLGLREEDRVGYLCFSLKERAIQLRLKRRHAHKKEQYEFCAAINRHLENMKPFLAKCNDDGCEL